MRPHEGDRTAYGRGTTRRTSTMQAGSLERFAVVQRRVLKAHEEVLTMDQAFDLRQLERSAADARREADDVRSS